MCISTGTNAMLCPCIIFLKNVYSTANECHAVSMYYCPPKNPISALVPRFAHSKDPFP